MDSQQLVATVSVDDITDDLISGTTAWTTWSIGLVTAVLGFLMLTALAKFMFNRF